jgi:predicted transposase YbfD/YdcC
MQGLVVILREVHDPRDQNARHELAAILFIALIATLCGCKNCTEIADFADGNEDDLRDWLALEHGAPSHDTFSRVFRLLDPGELAQVLVTFMTQLRRVLGIGRADRVVAVDGKSLRRGYEKGRQHVPPLMVSVWDAETRMAIAQARAPDRNEVAATLELLKTIDLKGCVVTADALHCHAAMAQAVIDAKGHYALGLKGNQLALFAAAQEGFASHGTDLPVHETTNKAHGRIERRRVDILPVARLPKAIKFPGLKAFGRIRAERTDAKGQTVTAVRYIALSKLFTPAKLAVIIRTHWTVENQLHWTLDVVFHEDDARTRKDHGPENLAIIRRFAHNILRAHPLNKPMAAKMRRAMWRKEFLLELFAHMR